MADFYILRESTNEAEIGYSFPQIVDLPNDYDKNANNSLYKIEPGVLPKIALNLVDLPLASSAKLTDIISTAYISRGLLLSNNAKDIISNFNLPEDHKYYEASVLVDDITKPYFLLLFDVDLTKSIDFPNSKFYVGFDVFKKEEEFNFENAEEYKKNGMIISPNLKSLNLLN